MTDFKIAKDGGRFGWCLYELRQDTWCLAWVPPENSEDPWSDCLEEAQDRGYFGEERRDEV